MLRKIAKIFSWFAAGVFTYVMAGIILSKLIFPAPSVDLTSYFRTGDKFGSQVEGFEQTVLGVYGDHIHTRLEIKPLAEGPPEHIHEKFEERFTVKEGTVSFLVNGELKRFGPGESVIIPPLTPHKPFNETNQVAIVQSDEDINSLPIQFGYFLSQIYPVMDQQRSDPEMILQLSVFGNQMDSWLANGPPIAIQKGLRIALEPTARLLGYRSFYPEYQPRR